MINNDKPYFELISDYKGDADLLPQRMTKDAVGYDFKAAEDIVIEPFSKIHRVTMIKTGVKAYLPKGMHLQLVNRSSNGVKHQLMNPNGIGIIDGDYYNNDSNEGHILFPVINFGVTAYKVLRGDRICQGIFLPQAYVKNDNPKDSKRDGGFGSTDNLTKKF